MLSIAFSVLAVVALQNSTLRCKHTPTTPKVAIGTPKVAIGTPTVAMGSPVHPVTPDAAARAERLNIFPDY